VQFFIKSSELELDTNARKRELAEIMVTLGVREIQAKKIVDRVLAADSPCAIFTGEISRCSRCAQEAAFHRA
jgi:hypothetical protein